MDGPDALGLAEHDPDLIDAVALTVAARGDDMKAVAEIVPRLVLRGPAIALQLAQLLGAVADELDCPPEHFVSWAFDAASRSA